MRVPDDEQSAQIATIVQGYRADMDALHEEFRRAYDPRYDAILFDAREAIKAVLTPEQAAEYQTLVDEREARKAEKEERDANGRRHP